MCGGKESALEPSGNESRVDVTAAARQKTSNKPDAKEDEAKTAGDEVDMTLAGGKKRNIDDEVDVSQWGKTTRKPIALSVGTNVCTWWQGQDMTFAGGKGSAVEPSGNESREDLTAASGQEASNKSDAGNQVAM
jgi:hypothetical protein